MKHIDFIKQLYDIISRTHPVQKVRFVEFEELHFDNPSAIVEVENDWGNSYMISLSDAEAGKVETTDRGIKVTLGGDFYYMNLEDKSDHVLIHCFEEEPESISFTCALTGDDYQKYLKLKLGMH